MFTVYAITNIGGMLDIQDKNFITADKNYLQAKEDRISVDKFIEYEQLNDVDYILPGNGDINFIINLTEYYQISQEGAYNILNGTLTSLDVISNDDIISGRMPKNEYEIVIDKMVYDNMIKGVFGTLSDKGITSAEELLNKEVSAGSIKKMTIVGIVDRKNPSIYTNKKIFINLLNEGSNVSTHWFGAGGNITSSTNTPQIFIIDYTLHLDDITLTKGHLPKNDYEVIVNKSNQDEMKLNKTIGTKINGTKLKVVGYYESQNDRQDYLVNNNTVKYKLINELTGFMIYPKNKDKVLNIFRNEYKINLQDKYEIEKEEYIKSQENSIKSNVIFACIILIVSLIEMYLIERSSFLSRIKEIGILRAIGLKKSDVYKMFLGEIIAITTIVSLLGMVFMLYILSSLLDVTYIADMFKINFETISLSVLLIYGVNIITGLMPLFKVLRKTPAQILSKHDIE